MSNKKKGFNLIGFMVFAFILSFYGASFLAAQDEEMLKKPIVYQVPGMDKVKAYKNITYKAAHGTGLKMDIYTPPGLSKASRLPVVIFIHGGYLPPGMTFKPKDWGVYVSYGQLMAASGLVGVTFNHRYYGWDEKNLNQSFGDVIAAIAYVRRHAETYHIDPDRVCLWAFSGGGPHLSIPLRDKMDFVRCLVSYYAVLDMPLSLPQVPNAVTKEKAKEYSPIYYLNEDNYRVPPILIGRAGLDGPALNEGVNRFILKALALNETIEILNHADGRHGFDILDDDQRSREIIARTVEFIKINLNKQYKPGTLPLPGAGRIFSILVNGKLRKAKQLLDMLKTSQMDKSGDSPYNRIVSESGLNTIGYQLLTAGKTDTAVEVFKWIIEMFPESPNTYDSLADGFEAAGDTKRAIEYSEKALQLLKKAAHLDENRRKIIRDGATARIKRLKGKK